ncbi:MAG: GAF domain-containing protein, partial [Anaerolineales bacterium]
MTKKSLSVKKTVKRSGGRKRNHQPPAISRQTIEQVRQLAWMGQHAKAIELATEALSRSGLKSEIQMDLLDLRAESYIAEGKLDFAAKDANAMLKLAKGGQKSKVESLQAQALIRKGILQGSQYEYEKAIGTLGSALKIARRNRAKRLEANSLYWLGESQLALNLNENARISAQQAADLYLSLGNPSNLGRALQVVAFACFRLGRREESLHIAQTALTLCEQVGDHLGKGRALNALSVNEIDLALVLKHLKEARQALEASGNVVSLSSNTINLGYTYFQLGLYQRAIRFYKKAIEIHPYNITFPFVNWAFADVELNNLDLARTHLDELAERRPSIADDYILACIQELLGQIALAEGHPRTAVKHFKRAVQIAQQAGLAREIGDQALLGLAYLAEENHTAALKATTYATKLHRDRGLPRIDDYPTQYIWWQHAQALMAGKKTKEARQALDRAYDFLLESIQNIRDVGLRRNYLNKVAVNRELIRFWVQDGTKRKLPNERLWAYLNIESNIREPFKRLAETSLRLNTLKNLAEIQTFLIEEATELSGGERVMLILEKNEKLEVADSLLPRGEDAQKVLDSIGKPLTSARLIRTPQLIVPKKSGLSRIVAPLIAQNQVIGYLYADMDSLYGTFDETDRDLLGMLANQGAVALDNAGLLEGLEQKVEARTEQLQERVSELQIINSIQQGLASKLDFPSIIDLVGEQVRTTTKAQSVFIALYDKSSGLVSWPYWVTNGERIPNSIEPLGKNITRRVLFATAPLNLGTEQEILAHDAIAPKGRTVGKSFLGVPFSVGNAMLGALSIHALQQEHAFTESDARLLQTLANSMSVALENARLFDETQRLFKSEQERVAELAIINSVQEGLASKLEMQDIYDLVGDKIREIFNADTTAIFSYDRKKQSVYAHYYVERDQPLPPLEVPFGQGLYTRVINSRMPLLFGTQQDWLNEGATIVNSPGQDRELNESYLGLPIVLGNEVTGVLSVMSYEQNAYGENDVRLLTTLANSMSVALQNAQSFKAEQERVAELQIINSIQQGLAAELNFQGIVDLVGDKLREVLNTGDFSIYWYDEKTKLAHYLYTYEHGRRLEISPRAPTPGGQFETMLRTRQPIVANHAADFERLNIPTVPGTDAARSLISIPIFSSDRVLGGIQIENHERENAFGESEIRLLTTIAASLGTALENARLFDETQRLLKETEESNAELAIITSVQQGLASKLDMQAIYDLVGDKIRQIFDAQVVFISTFDRQTNLNHLKYAIERSKRISVPPLPIRERLQRYLDETHQSVVINRDAIQA